MKLLTLALSLLLSVSLHAETTKTDDKKDQGKVIEAAKSASWETKKLLRKVGRKSMDESCELSNSKDYCDKQKAEHAALNKKEETGGDDGK